MRKILFLLCFVLAPLAACDADDTPTAITPTLQITSPGQNATVNLPGPLSAKNVAVNFETNWALKDPGRCGSDKHCGHLLVLVDSTTCNDGSKGYNTLAVANPVQVDLGKCPTATGAHTIRLELRDDRGNIVKNPLGDAVVSEVRIVAQ